MQPGWAHTSTRKNTSGFYLTDPYGLLTTVVLSRWLDIDLVLHVYGTKTKSNILLTSLVNKGRIT